MAHQIVLALATLFLSSTQIIAEPDSPDIVIILCDDFNPFYTGFAGDPDAKTPHLDALAAESAKFTHCYSASTVCMPARTCLVTGLYPHNTGCWGNASELFISPRLTSLFSDFKRAGYSTAMIGKTHWYAGNGFKEQFANKESYFRGIGIDHFVEVATTFGSRSGKGIYQDYLQEIGLFENQSADLTDRLRTNQYVARPSLLAPEQTCDWMMTDLAIEYFQSRKKTSPFVLMIGFSNPHSPFDPPGKYADMYPPESLDLRANVEPFKKYGTDYHLSVIRKARAAYLGKISYVDDLVGRLVTALKKRGSWKNTILVFTADHGMAVGEHGNIAKGQFWEEVARIPMLMRIPGITDNGVIVESLAQLIDLYPTLLDAVGGDVSSHVVGRSLLPDIRGVEPPVRDAAYSEIHRDGVLDYMVRTERFKWFTSRDKEYLFDLDEDPFEKKNLIGSTEHETIREQLKERLRLFLMKEQVNYSRGYRPLVEREKNGISPLRNR